jgi:glycosyltransferase involved in cell wall biosynthesis
MAEISIIVPTRNRAGILNNLLNSIARVADFPQGVEIIIVDNGSMDKTKDLCYSVAERFPSLDFRYFYDDMPGLLTGRHRGAQEARGEILAYLDDDVLLTPTWFDALQDAFRDPNVVLVGGPSTPVFEAAPPGWLQAFWTEFEGGRQCECLSLIECGDAVQPADPCYVWGLNFAIRKKTLMDCGGFHPDCILDALQRYQGDGETGLTLKIKDAGLAALYHPQLAVKHVIPKSRLTPHSLERRGFYQGVCDSFTEIRRDRGLPEKPRRSWKDVLRPAKWQFERNNILRNPGIEGMRRLHFRAKIAGRVFHQRQVRSDPKLLEWVLRPDYLDYRLPDGWKSYLNG